MKRIKETPATRRARQAWEKQWLYCWACGSTELVHTHHILLGGCRSDEPACWSRLCSYCHSATHGLRVFRRGVQVPKWTLGNILFFKATVDPDNYSHERLCEIKGEQLCAPKAYPAWAGQLAFPDRMEVDHG